MFLVVKNFKLETYLSILLGLPSNFSPDLRTRTFKNLQEWSSIAFGDYDFLNYVYLVCFLFVTIVITS